MPVIGDQLLFLCHRSLART